MTLKKIYLILFVLLPLVGRTQNDCSQFIKENIDRFTDKKTVEQKKDITVINAGGQKINLRFSYVDNTLVLTWENINEGSLCVDNDDILYFIFDDGSKSQVHYPSDLHCDPFFNFFFATDIFSDTYNLLITKQISSIRFFTTKAVLEFDLPKQSSQYLSNTISCLIQTGK